MITTFMLGFNTRTILRDLNRTLLTLIQKIKNPKLICQCRSISLSYTIYKTIN